ncbi:MAG: tRNA (adenosine(37)-N6)-dimethylallyltransferase MiaA [Pseudomonadota bacterium]
MRADDILALTERDLSRPVLIAGPTASGKSSLALDIARRQGRAIVNADAIQVFENWRILTARPSEADVAVAPHHLYGHIAGDTAYSVGQWLRELEGLVTPAPRIAPVIVGGTGLYFSALTEGLAEIPPTPEAIRTDAMARLRRGEVGQMTKELDPRTRDRIDIANPMRVQRAWEVLQATGQGLAHWQDSTAPPLLALTHCTSFVLDAPKDWLTPRIEARFDVMMRDGALDEARDNLSHWDPSHPSSKAIGASELVAVVKGEMTQSEARDRIIIATRQFAKRQRTWFRARMQARPSDWTTIFAANP